MDKRKESESATNGHLVCSIAKKTCTNINRLKELESKILA